MSAGMNDEDFCISILPRVSRTFALSIEALPEPLRSSIRVSYLLCRVVDTIEDDPEIDSARRLDLFREFAGVVGDDNASYRSLENEFAEFEGNDDRELCRNLGAPLRIFRDLPRPLADSARPHIVEMARGMAEYSKRWRGRDSLTVLEDQEDLERYCYYVAGTVGNLLTGLFVSILDAMPTNAREGLRDRAVSFGLGLQMTNIVKDVTTDRERGWCFLPRSFCARHGVSPEDLLEKDLRAPAMSVVRDVIGLARQHLDRALEYTLLLPRSARDVRLFVLVPLLLALSSLALVKESPNVLAPGKPVKVSRDTVFNTLTRAREVVEDDDAIVELCARAAALEL